MRHLLCLFAENSSVFLLFGRHPNEQTSIISSLLLYGGTIYYGTYLDNTEVARRKRKAKRLLTYLIVAFSAFVTSGMTRDAETHVEKNFRLQNVWLLLLLLFVTLRKRGYYFANEVWFFLSQKTPQTCRPKEVSWKITLYP